MSTYYPIFLNLSGKQCVVIGGGDVAERKVNSLLEHKACVTVVSRTLTQGLRHLAQHGAIKAYLREYRPGDLAGAVLAIAATDNAETNATVAREGEQSRVLINVVDNAALSDFIAPSIVRKGDITIAISTSGKSPALARKLAAELEEKLAPECAALASMLSEVRLELKQRGVAVSGETWQECLDLDPLLELIRRGEPEKARQALLSNLLGKSIERSGTARFQR